MLIEVFQIDTDQIRRYLFFYPMKTGLTKHSSGESKVTEYRHRKLIKACSFFPLKAHVVEKDQDYHGDRCVHTLERFCYHINNLAAVKTNSFCFS